MSITRNWMKEDNFAIFGRSYDQEFAELVDDILMHLLISVDGGKAVRYEVGGALRRHLRTRPELKEKLHRYTAADLNRNRIHPAYTESENNHQLRTAKEEYERKLDQRHR